MIEPEIPNSIATSFGFRILDKDRGTWTIKESACDCIVRNMTNKGMPHGEYENESKNRDTSYRFDFFPKGKGSPPVSYRIYWNGESLVLSVDMEDQPKKEKEWGGEEDEEEIRRLNKFIGAINDCIGKTLGFKKPTPMEYLGEKPDDDEEDKPNPYGYAKKEDNDELEKAFGKLSFGKKEGGKKTRRQKKGRATRRRKTNLHNRRR